jgi:hypothetical protein
MSSDKSVGIGFGVVGDYTIMRCTYKGRITSEQFFDGVLDLDKKYPGKLKYVNLFLVGPDGEKYRTEILEDMFVEGNREAFVHHAFKTATSSLPIFEFLDKYKVYPERKYSYWEMVYMTPKDYMIKRRDEIIEKQEQDKKDKSSFNFWRGVVGGFTVSSVLTYHYVIPFLVSYFTETCAI